MASFSFPSYAYTFGYALAPSTSEDLVIDVKEPGRNTTSELTLIFSGTFMKSKKYKEDIWSPTRIVIKVSKEVHSVTVRIDEKFVVGGFFLEAKGNKVILPGAFICKDGVLDPAPNRKITIDKEAFEKLPTC